MAIHQHPSKIGPIEAQGPKGGGEDKFPPLMHGPRGSKTEEQLKSSKGTRQKQIERAQSFDKNQILNLMIDCFIYESIVYLRVNIVDHNHLVRHLACTCYHSLDKSSMLEALSLYAFASLSNLLRKENEDMQKSCSV